MDRHLGRCGDHVAEAARELLKVRLREVAVERLAVRPLLDGHERERVLDGREEPVRSAALLQARRILHALEEPDQRVAVLGPALDPADHQ